MNPQTIQTMQPHQPIADYALPLFLAVGNLATYAMVLYAVGFFLLLTLTALVVKRLTGEGNSARLRPWGLVIIGTCILVFAVVAAALVLQPVLTADLDRHFLATLAQKQASFTPAFFAFCTRFADTPVLTLLCIAVTLVLLVSALRKMHIQRWYTYRQGALAAGWVMAVAGNALLNPSLKALFDRARPLHDNVGVFAHGLSFPSGHTSGAIVAYGMLAFVLIRWLQNRTALDAHAAIQTAARPFDPHKAAGQWWRKDTFKSRTLARLKTNLPFALALMAGYIAWNVAWSRMFLQVHFPTDVIAGFASGTAWLTVCILATDALLRRYPPPPVQPPVDELQVV